MESYLVNITSKAAEKLSKCTELLVGAGAGMGKDSGLPDFRGNEGFWNHYPPYKGKFNFYQCANPQFLLTNSNLFWGFYGSRLLMYREKKPHYGYHLLMKMFQKVKEGFIVTSNVDGHFSQIFDEKQLYEVHGSIHHLQCFSCNLIIPNTFKPIINYDKMSCSNLPQCPKCNANMRPNILMFQDWEWLSERSDQQEKLFYKFLSNIENQLGQNQGKLGIIQIGCGTAVPTIRNICEHAFHRNKGSILIRINPQNQNSWNQMDKSRFFHIKDNALPAIKVLAKQAFNIQ